MPIGVHPASSDRAYERRKMVGMNAPIAPRTTTAIMTLMMRIVTPARAALWPMK